MPESSLANHQSPASNIRSFVVFFRITYPPCCLIRFAQGDDVPVACPPFHFSCVIRMVHGPAIHSHIAIPHGASCFIWLCAVVVYCIRCYIRDLHILLLHQLGRCNIGQQLSWGTPGHSRSNIRLFSNTRLVFTSWDALLLLSIHILLVYS